VVNPSVFKKMPFDAINDITPICVVGATPFVLVVNPKVPAKNAKELQALLKARPDGYNYASSGNGTIIHLAAIGVMGKSRVPSLPDVPTIAEQGFPDVDVSGWFAVIGPAKLPPAEVRRLHAAVVAAFNAPEMKDAMAKKDCHRAMLHGCSPPGSTDVGSDRHQRSLLARRHTRSIRPHAAAAEVHRFVSNHSTGDLRWLI
jgi:tripartite-type tricarboxylate transporter receptor subunit TctC